MRKPVSDTGTFSGANRNKTRLITLCLLPVLLLPIIKTVDRDAMLPAKFFPVKVALIQFFDQGKHLCLQIFSSAHKFVNLMLAKVNGELSSVKTHHAEGIQFASCLAGFLATITLSKMFELFV